MPYLVHSSQFTFLCSKKARFFEASSTIFNTASKKVLIVRRENKKKYTTNCELPTNNSFGFTLIELLVVLSIIAILLSAGLLSYQEFAKSGRDAKRQSDLRGIQSALEQFHLDNLYYPPLSISCSNGKFTISCPLKSLDGTKTYLNSIPKDPLQSGWDQYCYLPSCNDLTKCQEYRLYAKLEKGADQATFNCGGGIYNFELTPP